VTGRIQNVSLSLSLSLYPNKVSQTAEKLLHWSESLLKYGSDLKSATVSEKKTQTTSRIQLRRTNWRADGRTNSGCSIWPWPSEQRELRAAGQTTGNWDVTRRFRSSSCARWGRSSDGANELGDARFRFVERAGEIIRVSNVSISPLAPSRVRWPRHSGCDLGPCPGQNNIWLFSRCFLTNLPSIFPVTLVDFAPQDPRKKTDFGHLSILAATVSYRTNVNSSYSSRVDKLVIFLSRSW